MTDTEIDALVLETIGDVNSAPSYQSEAGIALCGLLKIAAEIAKRLPQRTPEAER